MENEVTKATYRRYNMLSAMIENIQLKIRSLPSGRIRINCRGKYTYFYFVQESSKDGGRKLSNTDTELINGLLKKRYLLKVLKNAELEKEYLEQIMVNYPKDIPENAYDRFPKELQDRVRPIKLSDQEYVREWQARPFETKGIKDGLVRFTTMKGEEVRSKSEKIIADYLLANNIPYKYECPLKLPGGIIHPDFTILRVSDRKEIYHEHLGMMDKVNYTGDQPRRFNMYVDGGIMPGDRLFMSFESNDYPLDIKVIDKIAKTCFL